MSAELTLEEAALAWVQGKMVEAMFEDEDGGEWLPVDPVGKSLSDHHGASVFNDAEFRFRLAHEPPAKKFRPWMPEEVPVGARFRFNNTGSHQWIINGWNVVAIHVSNQSRHSITMGDALEEGCEHSIDGGKTWLPCGVEVDA